MKDLKWILESLKVNMQINQDEYPTTDPLKQDRQIKSAGSINTSSRNNTSPQSRSANRNSSRKDNSVIINSIVETLDSLDKSMSIKMPMASTHMSATSVQMSVASTVSCNDNRFPSTPVDVETNDDVGQ